MPNTQSVRVRLAARQPQVALFLALGSVAATEIAGHAGYDVLLIDHEHSPYDFENALHCMNAARGTAAEVWVRIPQNDQAYVKRILDCGADGIMCPMVNSAEDAARLVSYCRYAPRGVRGFAPTICRFNSYGYRREEYTKRIDHDLAIMVQIETQEGVDNADSIAAVEGVDIVFVGPADLSASLGIAGQFTHPNLAAAMAQVEKAARGAGKVLGTMLMPGLEAAPLIQRGYDFLIAGADLALMRNGMESQTKALREVFARR
jgi:2-keto-3-deoxy-L-rhamnonate aldolase RhmA